MNRLRDVLWDVRWSDGRRVSYGHDQIARFLVLLSLGLPVSGLVLYLWNGSFAVLVLFWLGGVVLGRVADARLRVIVSRIEQSGAGVPSLPPTPLLDRLYEFAARFDEQKEKRLLARSAKAEARGDRRAADRHRVSAARAREQADEIRSFSSSARDRDDSSRSKKVVDPADGAAHGVVAHDADYSGDFDVFGGFDGFG